MKEGYEPAVEAALTGLLGDFVVNEDARSALSSLDRNERWGLVVAKSDSSVECGVRSAECPESSAECGVGSAESPESGIEDQAPTPDTQHPTPIP